MREGEKEYVWLCYFDEMLQPYNRTLDRVAKTEEASQKWLMDVAKPFVSIMVTPLRPTIEKVDLYE